MRTLIVGHGGRESALAFRMAEHSELHAFMGHRNPSLLGYAEASGGSHVTGDVCDPQAVAAFARARVIDLAMVSSDEPLAAGVVDALQALPRECHLDPAERSRRCTQVALSPDARVQIS